MTDTKDTEKAKDYYVFVFANIVTEDKITFLWSLIKFNY